MSYISGIHAEMDLLHQMSKAAVALNEANGATKEESRRFLIDLYIASAQGQEDAIKAEAKKAGAA